MRLFSTDIDGTIYDGPESAGLFAKFWAEVRGRETPPLLVYNTGRELEDAQSLIAVTGLPEPDFLICGVGTVIFHSGNAVPLENWGAHLRQDWDFDIVWGTVLDHGKARPQPDECQNPCKCSWYWENADAREIDDLVGRIEQRGVRAQAIYSSNRDLDFLPVRANKGNAVAWLGTEVGVPTDEIVVAGDSGNDASMYEVDGVRGVLVSNAEPALIEAVRKVSPFQASLPCAAGVIEGLEHHLNRPDGGVGERRA